MQDIKTSIKAELRSRGITQVDIAKILRIHPVCVNEVITGKRKNPRVRLAIAMAVGKSVSDIWPDAAEEKEKFPSPEHN